MSSPYQVTHLDSLERGLAWLLEKYGGYTFSHKKVFKLKVDLLEQVAMSYKNKLNEWVGSWNSLANGFAVNLDVFVACNTPDLL